VQNVWKGFLIGAAAGAAIGLVLEALERGAAGASYLADEAGQAARDLMAEAERHAPEFKEAARTTASNLAGTASDAASRAREAVGERASAAADSVRS
jgi:hypothetical protein